MVEGLAGIIARSWLSRLGWIVESIRACPAELWEKSMFPVPWPAGWEKGPGFEAHLARFQVFSTPWLVAYHALGSPFETFGGVADSASGPPVAFGVPGERDFAPEDWLRDASSFLRVRYDSGASEWGQPYRVYTKSELLEFAGDVWSRGEAALGSMTDEELDRAWEIDPSRAKLMAERLIGDIQHMSEHGAELALFLGQARRD